MLNHFAVNACPELVEESRCGDRVFQRNSIASSALQDQEVRRLGHSHPAASFCNLPVQDLAAPLYTQYPQLLAAFLAGKLRAYKG
jgi:hypothetical protein